MPIHLGNSTAEATDLLNKAPRVDHSSPLKEATQSADVATVAQTRLTNAPDALMRPSAIPADETKLTIQQRNSRIDELVKSQSQISDRTKEEIAREIKACKLSLADTRKLLEAMNTSLMGADNKAEIENAFKALLDPKANVNLNQRDRDVPPQTLLDHIHALATLPTEALQRDLRDRKSEILVSLLNEISNPQKNINQGTDTSCVSTVALNQVAPRLSAEYARIIHEMATEGDARLVTDNGKRLTERIAGRQLAGTDPLSNNEPILQLDMRAVNSCYSDKRSITEAMFQAGAGRAFGAVDGGFYNGAAEKCYEHIFGVAFDRVDNAAKAIKDLERATTNGGYNMVSVKWSTVGHHSNHALEVLKIENGEVYFRNPWGKEFHDKTLKTVNATTVDAEKAIYKMDLTEFKNRINYALVSSSATSGQLAFGITRGNDESAPGFNPVAPQNMALLTVVFPVEATRLATNSGRNESQKVAETDRGDSGDSPTAGKPGSLDKREDDDRLAKGKGDKGSAQSTSEKKMRQPLRKANRAPGDWAEALKSEEES